MAVSGLISWGIGSPAGGSDLVLWGLSSAPAASGPSMLISLGIGSPASIGGIILDGLFAPEDVDAVDPDAHVIYVRERPRSITVQARPRTITVRDRS